MAKFEASNPQRKTGFLKRFLKWLNDLIGPEVHDDDAPESFRDLADGLHNQRRGEW